MASNEAALSGASRGTGDKDSGRTEGDWVTNLIAGVAGAVVCGGAAAGGAAVFMIWLGGSFGDCAQAAALFGGLGLFTGGFGGPMVVLHVRQADSGGTTLKNIGSKAFATGAACGSLLGGAAASKMFENADFITRVFTGFLGALAGAVVIGALCAGPAALVGMVIHRAKQRGTAALSHPASGD